MPFFSDTLLLLVEAFSDISPLFTCTKRCCNHPCLVTLGQNHSMCKSSYSSRSNSFYYTWLYKFFITYVIPLLFLIKPFLVKVCAKCGHNITFFYSLGLKLLNGFVLFYAPTVSTTLSFKNCHVSYYALFSCRHHFLSNITLFQYIIPTFTERWYLLFMHNIML